MLYLDIVFKMLNKSSLEGTLVAPAGNTRFMESDNRDNERAK